jgi:GPR1/FUN34/yaaH family
MPGDNGVHPELGDNELMLRTKEAKTYRSTIANPGPAYVFNFPIYHMHFNSLPVAVYSPSQPPHSCYLCSTSIHVEFGHQMLLLVWLFLRVVSCNSLQACGSSREAMYSELQVSFRTKNKFKSQVVPSCYFIKPIPSFFYAPDQRLLTDFLTLVAFSAYGTFWMSYAAIFIPGSGILAAFGNNTQELANALGLYLTVWFMFTVMLMYVYVLLRFLFPIVIFLIIAVVLSY